MLAVGATAAWRLVRPEPGGSYGTSPVWVGVREGDSVPAYVESSRAELAALAAQSPDRAVFALVSFRQYLTPAQVASVVAAAPGVGTVIGYARVPLPGRQTELVSLPAQRLPDDLIAGMAGVAGRKDLDADTYETLAASRPTRRCGRSTRPTRRCRGAEADAYRAVCACVLRAAGPGARRPSCVTLAGQAEVRAVDPAPDVNSPRDAVFSPPLPEQVDRVEPPPTNRCRRPVDRLLWTLGGPSVAAVTVCSVTCHMSYGRDAPSPIVRRLADGR